MADRPTTADGVSPSADTPASTLETARRVVRDEAQALDRLAGLLGPEIDRAVDRIEHCHAAGGTVLVSGLGKSGLIGHKISATFASLGIPSHFVHPTEAAHGDLGRFRSTDLCICLSHSGETAELVGLASLLAQDGVGLIAITRGSSDSGLARACDIALSTGVDHEAGGEQSVAPTCSTTATLALGDALALAAAERLRLGPADFARRHPGGQLGGLLRPVSELLRFRAGSGLAAVPGDVTVRAALEQASGQTRRPGAIVVCDADGVLCGILTDSDLRRIVLESPDRIDEPIAKVMTENPVRLTADATARDAVALVRSRRLDEIPVVDAQGRPVGLLDVQDLIAMKLVEA